ncbi:hypothetical protein NDN08_008354 [Rhodosorus marinus]|uniref:Uncharacterized protein n=1 Tax=Rhodosorus marinus TaxID=101924 RepID=A0AAV8V2Z5_9RHOD|nr:hypothetical protein NDN08_008354 [Rhodosorus marinus]
MSVRSIEDPGIVYERERVGVLVGLGVTAIVCFASVVVRRFVAFGFLAVAIDVAVYVYVSVLSDRERQQTKMQQPSPTKQTVNTISDWEDWEDVDLPKDRGTLYGSFREEWGNENLDQTRPTITTDEFDRSTPPVEAQYQSPVKSVRQGSSYSMSYMRDEDNTDTDDGESGAGVYEEAELVSRSMDDDENEVLTYEVKSVSTPAGGERVEQRETKKRSSSTASGSILNVFNLVRVLGTSLYRDCLAPMVLIASIAWKDIEILLLRDSSEESIRREVQFEEGQGWSDWSDVADGNKDVSDVLQDLGDGIKNYTTDDLAESVDRGIEVAQEGFSSARSGLEDFMKRALGEDENSSKNQSNPKDKKPD